MMSKYNLLIVHALDETTKFLLPFKNEFLEFYWEIKADHSNIQDTLNKISQKPKNSVIVFLGHGLLVYMLLMIEIIYSLIKIKAMNSLSIKIFYY